MTEDDATPPYLQVAEALRERITTGALVPGARLPSLTELSAEFGYSGTVGQRAYAVLVDEALVVSRPGAGHYVRSQEPATELIHYPRAPAGSGSPTEATLAEQGVEAYWKHESQTAAATEQVAARLGIEAGDAVMHTVYTYVAAERPAMLAESWEPMAITGSSLVVLPEAGPHAGIGVADRMAILGIDVGIPVERVRARTATRAEATRFGVAPGVPVMVVERTYYDQATGKPVEIADLVLLGSRWVSVYGTPPSV
ncbi:GntR family transcriptional regulator [Streptacidiphilus sp. PAMC 29251]